jgi:hypothetical protein
MKLPRPFIASLVLLLGAALVSSCATSGVVDPGVRTVLTPTTEKLKCAKTIHVSGTRVADPALLPPGATRESVRFDLEAVRPNSLEVKTVDAGGTRQFIASHGRLTYFDEKGNLYSSTATKSATMEGIVDEIEDQFDVKLIIGELLCEDPQRVLLEGVTSGRVAGEERVGKDLCTKLSFTQQDFSWDLWIARSDSLPRKTEVTYTGMPGHPKRTVLIHQWRLNTALPESDFTFTAPRGARQVEVIH